MKFSEKLRSNWLAIVAGALIFFAIFLGIFGNVWRVPSSIISVQPEQNAAELNDLLSFNPQHKAWEPVSGSDSSRFNAPLFDLFTPPNIYYDGTQLIMEPCLQWQFNTTFPLRLKNIKPKKYRLQFEGYIQPSPDAKYVIILHDLEHDQVLHCEDGQTLNSLEFAILSFDIKTVEQDGMIINTPSVQIFDSRIQQKFELTGTVKYYDDQYDVVLENIDGATYTLSTIGQETKIGESICILDKIDPDNKSVTITLIDANKQEFHKHLRMP